MPDPAERSDDTRPAEKPPASPARNPDRPEPTHTRDRSEPARRPSRPDWRALAREHWRLVVAGASLVTGLALVILGWYGAAYTNIITEQIPYLISGGLLGLGLIIFAGVLAASGVQKRDNEELRRDLVRALRALETTGRPSADRGLTEGAAPSANGHHVFVLPGGRSYHEAGCPIIEGKPDVEELVRADAAGSGYGACKLCGD